MWRVALWVSLLLLAACGKTRRDPFDVGPDNAGNGGGAGETQSMAGRGAGGSALGGAGPGGAGPGGTTGGLSMAGAAGARELSCDTGWSGYFGCSSTSVCQEPESPFAESAVRALCLPELGAMPVDGPCWTFFNFVGRCYDPSNEYWTYYYNDAEPAADCMGPGQIYCENPHGVPPALVETCRSACLEALPDDSPSPECTDEDDMKYCVSDCFAAIAGLDPACAQCVISSIVWEDGYCVDFECVCPGPRFVTGSDAECAASCN